MLTTKASNMLAIFAGIDQSYIRDGLEPSGLGDLGYLVDLVIDHLDSIGEDHDDIVEITHFATSLQNLAAIYAAENGLTLIHLNGSKNNVTIKGKEYSYDPDARAYFFRGLTDLYGECLFY
jgi:hypothetical protein